MKDAILTIMIFGLSASMYVAAFALLAIAIGITFFGS
jgi:hypothetical protein